MGEKLANPPLIEALCEFRFVQPEPWSGAIADELFKRVGEEFSVRSTAEDVNVDVGTGAITRFQRWQLKRPDESAMVQVATAGNLIVNHLRPYDRWETFLDLITRVLREFVFVVGTRQIQRIGLRYVNKLVPKQSPARVRDILSIYPRLEGAHSRGLLTMYQRYDVPHFDDEGILILQSGFGTSPTLDGPPPIMLDLDFGSLPARQFNADNLDDLLGWLGRAHDRVEEAFIASLQPDYYEGLKRGDK